MKHIYSCEHEIDCHTYDCQFTKYFDFQCGDCDPKRESFHESRYPIYKEDTVNIRKNKEY